MNRRDFIKQALLLPVAAVLPTLPEVEAASVLEGVEAKIWVNGELVNCEFVDPVNPFDFDPSSAFAEMGERVFQGIMEELDAEALSRRKPPDSVIEVVNGS